MNEVFDHTFMTEFDCLSKHIERVIIMCVLPITCLKFLKPALWSSLTTDLCTESSNIAAITPNLVYIMVCRQMQFSYKT